MIDRRPLWILAPGVALLGLFGCSTPGGSPAGDRPSSQRPRVMLTATERAAVRESSIEQLEALALSSEPQWRANAMEALRYAPQRAEPIIRAGLVDENPGVRFAAAMTAGRLSFTTLLPLIEPLRADPDQHVRMAAVYAIFRLTGSTDPQPLARSLRSPDPRVRSQAAFVLGELGEASAAPMLLEAARQAPPTGTAAERTIFELQAAEARLKLGDGTAADAIVSALFPATIEGFEAAVLAAQIIGQQNLRTAASQLVAIVETRAVGPDGPTDWREQSHSRPHLYPIELRLAAATSLAQLGFRDGGPVAEQGFASPNPLVRAQAAKLFAELARPGDLERLATMLDSPEPSVRAAAAAGLLRALQSEHSRG